MVSNRGCHRKMSSPAPRARIHCARPEVRLRGGSEGQLDRKNAEQLQNTILLRHFIRRAVFLYTGLHESARNILISNEKRRGSESNRRMGLLQSPALPLGYPAAGRGLPIHVDRRGDNGNLAAAVEGTLGLIERVYNSVLKNDLQPTHGDLNPNRRGIVAAAWHNYRRPMRIHNRLAIGRRVGRLRHEIVLNELPDLRRSFLICAIGDLLWLAETTSYFIDRHSDGDFISRDKLVDDLPAFLTLLEVGQESFGKRFQFVVRDPGGHTALLGIPAYPATEIGKGFHLDDLRKSQRPSVAGHIDVEVAGRRPQHPESKRLLAKVRQVNGAALPNDRPGLGFFCDDEEE